ncbi:MAG: hypothetical protein H0X35_02870 [Pseudonocardiales bacterium]|nr:hypothetical protein [Pseudonocardiales bacterium]
MGDEVAAEDGLLELSDAIGLVRQQLVRAQLDSRTVVAGKVVTFAVGKVTLELTGEIKSTVGASGEAKFWVLTAGAKAERAAGAGQKVTIELVPQGRNGESFVIADTTSAPPPR